MIRLTFKGKIMPLLKVFENSYCLSDALSIGVCINPTTNRAVLIDSGLDKSKIKLVEKALPSGCKISAIINTHSHADHCGGNGFVQNKNPDVRIYTTKFEQGFVEVPSHEPHGFNCLAEPFAELKNKFLCAEPSRVTDIIEYRDHEIVIEGMPFKIVTLPGHSAGMIGVISPDHVFYCGDAAFGAETFKKHGVLFYSNIDDSLNSLIKMKDILSRERMNGFVFYHGGPEAVSKVSEILDDHIEKISDTKRFIRSAIESEPRSMDDLTALVMTEFEVPNNIVQFSLTQTCVRAYVVSLQQSKEIELMMDESKKMKAKAKSVGYCSAAASTEDLESPCCGR